MTPTQGSSSRLLSGFALDLRATIRGLRRRPAFALTAIGTIALGVAASTAMFSAVDGILLRSLPFATPDRLVAVMPHRFYAQRDLDALRTRLTTLDQLTVFHWCDPQFLSEPRRPQRFNCFPEPLSERTASASAPRESTPSF